MPLSLNISRESLVRSCALGLSLFAMGKIIVPTVIEDIRSRYFPNQQERENRERFFKLCKEHNIIAKQQCNRPYEIPMGATILVSAPIERCKAEYKSQASQAMLRHFDLAEKLFDYVLDKVPHAVNFPSKTLNPDKHEHRKMALHMHCYHGFTVRNPRGHKKGLDWAKDVKDFKGGVCEDLAHVGKLHAWKKYPNQKVEFASIVARPSTNSYTSYKGRHSFLVIGRQEDSDHLDFTTWGKDCVICDIWAGKYYPVNKVNEEMYNYIGTLLTDAVYFPYPYVYPFDAKKLRLYVRSNKYEG